MFAQIGLRRAVADHAGEQENRRTRRKRELLAGKDISGEMAEYGKREGGKQECQGRRAEPGAAGLGRVQRDQDNPRPAATARWDKWHAIAPAVRIATYQRSSRLSRSAITPSRKSPR